MKKQVLLILFVLIFQVHRVFAQQKTDRFCMVYVYTQAFKKGKNIDIDYGQKNDYNHLKDSTTIAHLEAIKTKCNTMIDAVNYMSDLGWTLVQTTGTGQYTLIFKKEFDKSEIEWTNH